MTLSDRNDTVRKALDKVNCKRLNNDVEYYLDIDDDEERPQDVYEAVIQAEEFAEEHGDRPVLLAARRVLIALGVYARMTLEEIDSTTVWSTGGGRRVPGSFKYRGEPYHFVGHLEVACE